MILCHLSQEARSTTLGPMEIAEVWRYPVKSMGGERVEQAEVIRSGLPRDRGIAVFDPTSRRPDQPLSARDLPGLLTFRATVSGGEVLVAGPDLPPSPWRAEAVRARLADVCGRPLEMATVAGGAFDDSPIHVVALSSVQQLSEELGRAVDHRRFRANLYLTVGGAQRRCELDWVGARLNFGELVLAVTAECPRCVITTRDPDTNHGWPKLLRHLASTRDAMVGAYCRVERPGVISEGSPVAVG